MNQIDIVLATVLFILASPGLLITIPAGEKKGMGNETTSNLAVLVHAGLFFALNTAVTENLFGIFGYLNHITDALDGEGNPQRKVSTIIATLLFIILSPGLILTFPSFDGEMFFSDETSVLAILVHGAAFYALLRVYHHFSDNKVVKWINENIASGL
jgi:hypothetical protein